MPQSVGTRVGAALLSGMTFSAAMLLTAEPAAAVERAYAFGAVTVRGGLPVADVDDGLLLSQAMDETCHAVSTGPTAETAVAATPGAAVTLRFDVLGCRSAATPRVECNWSIEPPSRPDPLCRPSQPQATSGRGSWKSWEGDLELRAPAASGLYDLSVNCSVRGEGLNDEQSLSLPFYVTYAEPLFAFSPPQVDWYERACCWGAGFTAEAEERDVLQALLMGLYRYGGVHWHYGYGQRVEDGRYTFPLHETQGGQVELEYVIAEQDLRPECFKDCGDCCRCYWQGLISEATPCDFADCYVFSDVLGAVAGVMGIGGLIPIEIEGAADQGFVTVPARSLDPSFRGNVICPGLPSCPYPYYFGSHSLRRRDRLYYDATFDRTYDNPEEPIGLNVDRRSPCAAADALTFLDNDTIMFTGKEGYGQWPYISDPGVFCEGGLQGVPPVSPVAFAQHATFEPMDRDGEGFFESLTARLEVEVLVEGTYLFLAQLFDGERDEVVASKPHWDSNHPTTAGASGPPGRYQLELAFSGQQIYDSGRNGPYWLRVHLGRGHRGEGSSVWIESPPFDFSKFGEQEVEIIQVSVPETVDRSQPLPALPIDVNVSVRNPGAYLFQSRLAKDGVTLSYAGWKQELTPADALLRLDIPGAPIARSGVDGPYELTLEVYGPWLTVIDSKTLPITGFDASSFASGGGT